MPQERTPKLTDESVASNAVDHKLLEKEAKLLFEKMLVISRTSCVYVINIQFI